MTLEVPPKKEIIVYAPLTAKQEAFYTAIVNKTIAKMLGVDKVSPCYSKETMFLINRHGLKWSFLLLNLGRGSCRFDFEWQAEAS